MHEGSSPASGYSPREITNVPHPSLFPVPLLTAHCLRLTAHCTPIAPASYSSGAPGPSGQPKKIQTANMMPQAIMNATE